MQSHTTRVAELFVKYRL